MNRIDTVSKADFKKLVEKVGGKDNAAAVMEVSPATVANALGDDPDRFLSLRALLELQRAAGVLEPVAQPMPGNGAGEPVFMSVKELGSIDAVRFSEVEHGFQRDMNLDQVAEIEAKIRGGFTKFPPIVVGMTPDGTSLLIDGQHRRAAHVNAGIGCYAHVYEVKDLDEARLLYLVWNGRSRRPTARESFEASRNHVAGTLKRIAEKYAVTFEQVCAVFRGLIGQGVDFVEPNARIPRETVERAEAILDAWTKDPRWGSKRSEVFNSITLLRALGVFARSFSPKDLEPALRVIRERRDGFRVNFAWGASLRRGPRSLAVDFMNYVVPRLHGGETNRNSGRGRVR